MLKSNSILSQSSQLTALFLSSLCCYLAAGDEGISLDDIPQPFRIQREIEDGCTPDGNPGMQQYIIGYGSLLSSASKNRTYPNTSDNIPIRVRGYNRIWNCKGVSSTLSTTYLGVKSSPEGSFNGAMFSLDSGSRGLRKFDERESFYCRKEVPKSNIEILGKNAEAETSLPDGQYWIYVTKSEFTEPPSKDYPIVQSYVDIFITGCLELERNFEAEGFSDECVRSTRGWSSNFWINDRIHPRRPFMYQPRASDIDKLLRRIMPRHFKNIKIE